MNLLFKAFAIIFFFILLSGDVCAQIEEDTIIRPTQSEKLKKGSIFSGRPGKAFLMSLIVPGAGQIYNKSYLRVPFVWGAVGGVGLVLQYNTRQYHCYRAAYISKIDGTLFVPPNNHCKDIKRIPLYTAASVRSARDQANEDRQTMILVFSLVWLANGVDAFVDAHLKDFDIEEDLSIDIGPRLDNDPFAPMRMGIFVQF